jgi:phosphoenolpyruvate-protein phosphotransferase (PTS system enzyme I)
VEAYMKIAEVAGEEGVKIRTFDLGAEQALDRHPVRERNPALGLRALRLGLAYPQQLRTQLRALLRASHRRRIDIILPMVSGLGELREVRRMLEAEKASLRSRGKVAGDPGLGVMIEIPAAVLIARELAVESDFVCLGTNDLIQYLLAADRENQAVADWYRTLHPSVIRAVGMVIKAGIETGKRVIVCGEMAGSPFYVPVLIGLGATDLSMNVQSLDGVRRLINGLAAEECRRLIRQVSNAATPDEAEAETHKWILANWVHLLSNEMVRGMRRRK